MACRLLAATGPAPGAIAIVQLHGDVEAVLAELTGRSDWPPGRARLAKLADIDVGLVACLDENVAQVMPHAGPRVRQLIVQWLLDHGVEPCDPGAEPAAAIYPEAADRFEALALAAIARAASPLAVDLLLEQPARWRRSPTLGDEDLARSHRLDRLIVPPVVVVAGPANVGKSTLSNALLGRALSIASDRPGTTRDYTSGRIELAGCVVDWHDTPGLRVTDDEVEHEARALAATLMERAECLIAMSDHEHPWPDLSRAPDIRVRNKIDLDRGESTGGVLGISALSGEGLDLLVRAVRDTLVPPGDLAHPGPWLFDPRLEPIIPAAEP
jgi:tRNA modification GTPase